MFLRPDLMLKKKFLVSVQKWKKVGVTTSVFYDFGSTTTAQIFIKIESKTKKSNQLAHFLNYKTIPYNGKTKVIKNRSSDTNFFPFLYTC